MTLNWKYQTPYNRNIVVGGIKGRRAVFAGAACVLFVLITVSISDLFLGVLIGLPTALIGGFALAAIVNWFSEWRGNSNEV